jgi:hypothetical protein
MQTGKGSVKVERSEPKGNLDGFLARLHDSEQNEGGDRAGYRPFPFRKEEKET